MKTVYFIIGLLAVASVNAQKFDCSSKTASYQELLKANKVKDSYEGWSEVRKNCPKEEAVYTDGMQILQYRIENAAAEEKEKSVRDLMKLYDQYNKNFPSATPDYEVKKAMALITNKIEAKEEIFGLLDSGFATASQNVTDANAIYTYFSLYAEKFNTGDKKITSNAVLEKYTLVNSLLNQLVASHPQNPDYKTALNAVDNQIKTIATCENLSDFYTRSFEKNKENADWIAAALISLSENCGAKPIFQTLAEKLYSMKVTAQSANFQAIANLRQRKFPEAIKFYEESANLQTNPVEKAKVYFTLATGLLAGDLAKSKEYLDKTVAADPKMGKAYLYLAQMYINNSKDCTKTDFEKKAIYNLAIKTLQKAGVAEPRLKPTVDKMAADYTPKSLTDTEISQAKMSGKSVSFGCWINETISFPSK